MNNKKALKAGIWYTISNFIVKGLAFLTMPIFTRIMSQSDIGLFSNITSWFSILAIVTTFELYSSISIARFDHKDNLKEYISSTLILGTIITSIFYIMVLIFHNFFQNLFMIDFTTLNIIFIYLLVYPSIQMFQLKNQIEYNYKSTIIVSLLNAFLSTAVSIILVILFKNQLNGRIYGYFIPLITVSTIIYVYLLLGGKKVSKKYWKYAIKISFPLIWHLLAGYILSSADKIMITRMVSTKANALYSVAYTISQIASILWVSMNEAWSPWAYDMMDKKEYNELRTKSKPYFLLYLIIIFGMLLVTPELLLLMGGKDYYNARFVIPPVMIGYIFQFVYSLYVNIEFYNKKQKNIAIGTIIAALLNIILNFIFIPIFGYIAAAYTTLVGYIALYVIHRLFVKKLNCNWYDGYFFNKILLFCIISEPLIVLIYVYNIIRYILIIAMMVIICYNIIKRKDKINDAIKRKSVMDIINAVMSK